MSILGNIFLIVAALISLFFFTAVISKDPPTGGDAVVGYAWGLIIFYLVFWGCMTVVTVAIAWKGGFEWISPNGSLRSLLLVTGFIGMALTSSLALLFRGEPGVTAAGIRLFSGFAPWLVPLFMMVGGAVLLNDGIRASVPALVYKVPIGFNLGIGLIGLVVLLVGWMADSNKNAIRAMESRQEDEARYHQNHLDYIDTCDVTKDMVNILVYTDSNHDQDVREKAIAKIKTNPAWQQELIKQLENKGSLEVFTFLASNEVDDKTLFAEPVNKGVLSVAEWIRREIRTSSHPSHFYADRFRWEIERMLRSIDKFEGMGVDYVPAVREVRAAFNEPCDVEQVKMNCVDTVDAWLKKREKK